MSAVTRVVRRAVELARSQAWLREPAGRAVDAVVAASRVPPPGLRPGSWSRSLGARADDLPVVLVDVTGVDAGRLAHLVEHLPQVSAACRRARFVLVLDGAHLALGRRSGVVVEHLLDERAWSRRHPVDGWPAHRERRLAQLRSTYRPVQVVALPSGDPTDLQAQLATAVAGWRAPGPMRRAWARIERVLDPPPAG